MVALPNCFRSGNCLELAGAGYLNHFSCNDTFLSGCPDTFYFGDEIFKCKSLNLFQQHYTQKQSFSITKKCILYILLWWLLDLNNEYYLLILADPKCLEINVNLRCFVSDTQCIKSRFVEVNNKYYNFIIFSEANNFKLYEY